MKDFANKDYARERQSVSTTLLLSTVFVTMCALLAWRELSNFFGF